MSEAIPSAAIQPIGFLVTLSSDWRISAVSANVGDYVGVAPDALLGQPVTSLFSPTAIHSLRNRLALLRGPHATERLFSVSLTGDATCYDVAVHMSGEQAVIEAEPSREHHHDRESTGTVRGMIAGLAESGTFKSFFSEAARHMRALTGYDRVTIHRFGENGAEETVGETERNGGGAAMGNRLARSASSEAETAMPVRLRLIADIDAEPVPVIPSKGRPVRPADLSRSMLRTRPSAEIDQLRDVGIHAALSIPLVIEDRLWGMIACHHRTAHCPTFERRSAVEWYAMMLAMQIEIRELRAKLKQ